MDINGTKRDGKTGGMEKEGKREDEKVENDRMKGGLALL